MHNTKIYNHDSSSNSDQRCREGVRCYVRNSIGLAHLKNICKSVTLTARAINARSKSMRHVHRSGGKSRNVLGMPCVFELYGLSLVFFWFAEYTSRIHTNIHKHIQTHVPHFCLCTVLVRASNGTNWTGFTAEHIYMVKCVRVYTCVCVYVLTYGVYTGELWVGTKYTLRSATKSKGCKRA